MNVLLIPGFMLDAELWVDMRYGLDALGRTVDVDTSQDTSIGAIARRALAASCGPMIVIGFSMGGYVAREIVYQAPERVKGLALIATSCEGDSSDLAGSMRGSAGAIAVFRHLSRAVVAKSLSPANRTDTMIERVQRMSERLGATVLDRQSQIWRENDKMHLSKITCPTVVVAGCDDELRTIAESKALHDGIAGSSLVMIKATGHLIPLEQPTSLLEALSPLRAFVHSLDQ